MLRDATGHGFIEEFDEYVSRFIASPDNTGTLPPPSPPSGRGDVLRIRSPESTRDAFRIVESFFLLAPRAYGAGSLATTQREKFRDSLSRDIHSLGAGTGASFFEGAFNCASFLRSMFGEFVPPCAEKRAMVKNFHLLKNEYYPGISDPNTLP